jgi:hypothetical protein
MRVPDELAWRGERADDADLAIAGLRDFDGLGHVLLLGVESRDA